MKQHTRIWTLLAVSALTLPLPAEELPPIEEKTSALQRHEGFFSFYWDEAEGKVWLEIGQLEEEFLYVVGLSTGLGSNPVGLDRAELGADRIVKFVRVGPRVLMVEPNQRYRALTDNEAEARAVRESFAQSVLWGARVAAQSAGRVLVDATDLLLSDAHGVAGTLQRAGQGDFRLDRDRSAVYLPRSRAFPDNTELEALLTFTGSRPGPQVRDTAPTATAVSVRQHHSFIRLPDAGYRTRAVHPRTSSGGILFYDYAAPLDQSLKRRYIARHRLEKRDPSVPLSEPVEPIIYYVDPGAPEPVRSALIEGASWWNEAFEAAGYRDAFRVKVLPDAADPMDVRYNVINWVHRSTRGWSYGSSVRDPRTGEIIKGHVTLGSLRVRQDRMIMEGLSPDLLRAHSSCQMGMAPGPAVLAALDPDADAVEVALARIRQLAAHEVGHTLGFAHNFAASTYGRASVMDYPAPLIRMDSEGKIDVTEAYDTGIGEWDRFSVRYAYSDFPEGVDEEEALEALIQEAINEGWLFITDADARPAGAAQPQASLWDNGSDPVASLRQVLEVRRAALDRFSERNIPEGAPLYDLQEVLVPVYLYHRYQTEAAAKLLGGACYTYAVRGDGQQPWWPVAPQKQREALAALLDTLEPGTLILPQRLLRLMPPLPFSHSRYEPFPSRTSPLFDPLAAARVAADLTVSTLLQPERAARLLYFHRLDAGYPSLEEVIDTLTESFWHPPAAGDPRTGALLRVVGRSVLDHLMRLAEDSGAAPEVRAVAEEKLRELGERLSRERSGGFLELANSRWASRRIERFLKRPAAAAAGEPLLEAPPGSPIGSGSRGR